MNLYDLNYDPSYNIVFEASWCDWEEYGWIYIFEKDGKYYALEGGHCVMCESYDTTWDDLYLVSEDEALELMFRWAEHED